MNNKRFVKVVAIVLAFLMLLSVIMIALTVIADTNASARVTQTQIDNLRNEQRGLQRRRNEIESRINTIEFERTTEILKKGILDERIMVTGLEIENINNTIEYFNILIREKEYEVFLAQTREDEQLARFRDRVRNMEENGIITYLEIIFDSTSFADMLARIDFVSDIMRADQEAHDDLMVAREETEGAKEVLEETRLELGEEKLRLEEKEEELYAQVEEASALILQMEANIDTERQLRASVVEDETRVLREINAAVAELERQRQEAERQRRLREQQARQQANNSSNNNAGAGGAPAVGTGTFVWPAQGRITSPFGVRQHPVHGDMRQHNGIDIGAANRSPVVAADSGSVVTSRWCNSFGNFIVISHGNGVNTLYAHLSARHVSVGDNVSRGQQIGLVGSTGVSTGPHLHFEVHHNGARVNPENWLP
ncbi:MAG: peptidoglycan DD-metalloendopeptidase family protein [Oscillospiraceae bacterium]|nr:peptidoglycan DD-metalloendopeptidase family protein [Oscillospiraceae bacterium]